MIFSGPIQVGTHFSWSEALFTTHRDLIDGNRAYLESRPDVQANVRELVRGLLEPIRTQLGPVIVHSWVRCPDLNKAVGGSPTSQHMVGAACDFHLVNHSLDVAFEWLAHSTLPYHQLIREPIGAGEAGWIHVGLYQPGERNGQVLR